MTLPLYPLRFKEVLRDYSFGDRWIARDFAKTGLPEGHPISETWEIVDRGGTDQSVVTNGPLASRTLRELIETDATAVLGKDIVRDFGPRFPLLIKLLDASKVLGEQAHFNDEQTRQRGIDDYSGKTEAWYMLRVKPGATVECGCRNGLSPADVEQALLTTGVRPLMNKYEPRVGDAFLLYAGAMHYSSGGVLFYEIMQNSNVYLGLAKVRADLPEDQRRAKARDAAGCVHLEDDFDPRPVPVTIPAGATGKNTRTFVLACRYFALERMDLQEPMELGLDGRKFLAITCVEGTVEVQAAQCGTAALGCAGTVLLAGQSALLPADLGKVTLTSSGQAAVLKAYVPGLKRDIVDVLRAAGVDDSPIAGLGGCTRLNDLREVLRS